MKPSWCEISPGGYTHGQPSETSLEYHYNSGKNCQKFGLRKQTDSKSQALIHDHDGRTGVIINN